MQKLIDYNIFDFIIVQNGQVSCSMNILVIKILCTIGIVLSMTEIADKYPKLAGFLIALPTLSLITLIFSHIQYKEAFDTVKFCKGMLLGVPGLTMFYIPFLFMKNIYASIAIGFILTLILFFVYKHFDLI
jgi:hypothetical protein